MFLNSLFYGRIFCVADDGVGESNDVDTKQERLSTLIACCCCYVRDRILHSDVQHTFRYGFFSSRANFLS